MNHLQEAKKIFQHTSDAGQASELSYGEYALLGGMIAIAEQLEKMNENTETILKCGLPIENVHE